MIYSDKMPQRKEVNINYKNMLYESILTKSKDWEYEAEWRVIHIDKDSGREDGKSINFVKPVCIYLGKRQHDTVKKNNKKLEVINEKTPDISTLDAYASDKFQVDINKIIEYKHDNEKIKLYGFDLSRDSFQLKRRTYKV